MARAHDDPDHYGGLIVYLTAEEATELTRLVFDATEDAEGRIVVDDGPLLALLEALAPTDPICTGCGDLLDHDTVIYATKDGVPDTNYGNPYCDGCLPAQYR